MTERIINPPTVTMYLSCGDSEEMTIQEARVSGAPGIICRECAYDSAVASGASPERVAWAVMQRERLGPHPLGQWRKRPHGVLVAYDKEEGPGFVLE